MTEAELDNPLFCEHANENPNYCPCPKDCWCNKNSYRMCWNKLRKRRAQIWESK